MIHGGRANLEPPLYQTHGCIRVYNDDIKTITDLIENSGGGTGEVHVLE